MSYYHFSNDVWDSEVSGQLIDLRSDWSKSSDPKSKFRGLETSTTNSCLLYTARSTLVSQRLIEFCFQISASSSIRLSVLSTYPLSAHHAPIRCCQSSSSSFDTSNAATSSVYQTQNCERLPQIVSSYTLICYSIQKMLLGSCGSDSRGGSRKDNGSAQKF